MDSVNCKLLGQWHIKLRAISKFMHPLPGDSTGA
jgi:hypothetical protein